MCKSVTFTAEEFEMLAQYLHNIQSNAATARRINHADRREPADTRRLSDAEQLTLSHCGELIKWVEKKRAEAMA